MSNQSSKQAKPSQERRHRPITHVAPKGKIELIKQVKNRNIIKTVSKDSQLGIQ